MSRLSKTSSRKFSVLAAEKTQIVNLIQQGLVLHRQGNLQDAESIYKKVLDIQGNNFDALNFLGLISIQSKKFLNAIEYLSRALLINSSNPTCYSNLGIAFKGLQRFDEALISYEKAISLKSDFVDAYYNRGNLLKDLGQFQLALNSYNQAIELKPNFEEAYFNRGYVLQELENFIEALESYDKAITLKPYHSEAYFNRGNVLLKVMLFDEALASYDTCIGFNPEHAKAFCNRGNVLQKLKRLDEALASYDKAISLNSNYSEAYYNRGVILQELSRSEEALTSYELAININPDYLDAYSSHGAALAAINRVNEALASYDLAININPNHASSHSNRGNALQELNRLDEALVSYKKAISINADHVDAHWNLALANLKNGNLIDGFQGYEWRSKNEKLSTFKTKRNFTQPLWLGEQSLQGKKILLYAEQGLGDVLQFSRYVPLVAQLGAQVILEVHAPLFKLLKHLGGVSQIIALGDNLPEFDYQCSLLSLPLVFKTELDTIPPVPLCINSDVNKVINWQIKLGEKVNLRVGLVWSGSNAHANDHNRSLTLAQLIPYLPPNIQYVCLQKEIREVDQELLAERSNIIYFGDVLEDFTDTAALCDLMDLVISVDTSVGHLSATLGKPTWMLLAFAPDWRWLLNRNDSPWYPSVKLYRQEEINNWDGILGQVKKDLERLSGS
jgi:tetratricopeptide (TPR) repeat protein